MARKKDHKLKKLFTEYCYFEMEIIGVISQLQLAATGLNIESRISAHVSVSLQKGKYFTPDAVQVSKIHS